MAVDRRSPAYNGQRPDDVLRQYHIIKQVFATVSFLRPPKIASNRPVQSCTDSQASGCHSIWMRFISLIRVASSILLAFALVAAAGCGLSTSSGPRPPGSPPPPPGAFPQFGHVVLVVEENHSYSEVIGSSSMPYLNSLASQYGLATQYFANTHPSIGNYFMLTTGQIVTNDDAFTGPVSVDNIVRDLLAAGKTWKSYAESIPSVGYTGGDSYPYAKRHNILSYFTDVTTSSTQVKNLVPFSQFSSDLANNQLPDFSLSSRTCCMTPTIPPSVSLWMSLTPGCSRTLRR